MKKILIAPRENRCIGCGLCVVKSCLLIGDNIDLSKAFIKITGNKGKYKIIIDYGVHAENLDEIVKICPKNCFEIAREETPHEE